jgi:hypothetical protein
MRSCSSIPSPDDLRFDIIDDPAGPMFFNQLHTRGLSVAQPDLTIPGAPPEKQAVLVVVSRATILDALAPRDFVSFAGARAVSHNFSSGFGVLESQPHNLVHNCAGGSRSPPFRLSSSDGDAVADAMAPDLPCRRPSVGRLFVAAGRRTPMHCHLGSQTVLMANRENGPDLHRHPRCSAKILVPGALTNP